MRKLLLCVAVFGVAVACSDEPLTSPESVFGLELAVTPSVDTLVTSAGGDADTLVATATRNGVAIDLPGHEWASSDSSVAIVSQTGVVTARSPGTAEISVRVNSVKAKSTIVVLQGTAGGGGPIGGGPVGPLVAVSSGGDASCGVTQAGQAFCWGVAPAIGIARDTSCFDVEGTTGDPKACTVIPLPIAAQISLRTVSVGETVACGITPAGAAYCWGSQKFGQVGNGIAKDATAAAPTAVTGPLAAAGTFTQIAAGGQHACGLIASGAAFCWGRDTTFQIGGGGDNIAVSSSTPTPAGGNNTYKSIATGRNHTCALRNDGVAFCWGDNRSGQLGRGVFGAPSDSALAVAGPAFTQIAAGGNSSCGLTSAGTVYCWGANESGETGQPVSPSTPTPSLVAGSGYTSITVGGAHACALTATGVSCWGSNSYGQLGRGFAVGSFPLPAAVTGGRTYTALSSGLRTSCAIAADGTYCWGSSIYGATGGQVQAIAVTSPQRVQMPQ
jgi:alpha-tubulin suppressor-like RCC1 family protein